MNNIIYIKGRKIDQRQLRNFLDGINLDDFRGVGEDGLDVWKSPITGELFRTKFQLHGHIGAYLRTPNRKDVTEPSRRGYMRALRAGVDPTDEQRDAHRRYVAAQRANKKLAEASDAVHARVEAVKDAKPHAERRKEFLDAKAKRIADRKARVDAAFAAEESAS